MPPTPTERFGCSRLAALERLGSFLWWMFAFVGLLSSAMAGSPDEPATPNSACTAVYLLVPHIGIGGFNDPVKIFIATDDGAFEEKGYLWQGDWGAFHSCGQALRLHMQRIAGLNAAA